MLCESYNTRSITGRSRDKSIQEDFQPNLVNFSKFYSKDPLSMSRPKPSMYFGGGILPCSSKYAASSWTDSPQSMIHTHTRARARTHAHTRMGTDARTHTHTHKQILRPAEILHSQYTRTRARAHKHTHTHTPTYTHTHKYRATHTFHLCVREREKKRERERKRERGICL